ncbi:polysaccharide deacetylase family protein [Flagellimonas meridianipacifica]|nr:polysaccharide deacetylase family protein [Allomuricauda pacifica]
MRIKLLMVSSILLASCNQTMKHDSKESVKTTDVNADKINEPKNRPKVSFTFDDGITTDLATFKFEEWNQMILDALDEAELNSTFFVTGSNKLDAKGISLLESWSSKGHQIANHTFTHPYFNSDKKTVADFEEELLKTDSVISKYSTFSKLFRFPYLKEGNTEEKVLGFREILKKHGYKNGHVTIDASDWYVNSELIKCIDEEGINSPKIAKYKEFYLQHILERATYYERLSFELTRRHIDHTLLLHHNLTSALFLPDLIQRFKDEGWELVDSRSAFTDEVYEYVLNIIPAGESLIWAMAKETGNYNEKLRYPAEDSRYEKPKMEKLGL